MILTTYNSWDDHLSTWTSQPFKTKWTFDHSTWTPWKSSRPSKPNRLPWNCWNTPLLQNNAVLPEKKNSRLGLPGVLSWSFSKAVQDKLNLNAFKKNVSLIHCRVHSHRSWRSGLYHDITHLETMRQQWRRWWRFMGKLRVARPRFPPKKSPALFSGIVKGTKAGYEPAPKVGESNPSHFDVTRTTLPTKDAIVATKIVTLVPSKTISKKRRWIHQVDSFVLVGNLNHPNLGTSRGLHL